MEKAKRLVKDVDVLDGFGFFQAPDSLAYLDSVTKPITYATPPSKLPLEYKKNAQGEDELVLPMAWVGTERKPYKLVSKEVIIFTETVKGLYGRTYEATVEMSKEEFEKLKKNGTIEVFSEPKQGSTGLNDEVK